jgi:hypothetical protein
VNQYNDLYALISPSRIPSYHQAPVTALTQMSRNELFDILNKESEISIEPCLSQFQNVSLLKLLDFGIKQLETNIHIKLKKDKQNFEIGSKCLKVYGDCS